MTEGTKSKPIDAILLVKGNATICSLMKEKALILYEKLLRISMDKFTKTSENAIWFNTSIELKKELRIDDKPKRLPLPMNPLADTDVVRCTQLVDYFGNSNTTPEQMRPLAFETINANYSADQ
ncbi:unnamed protein product [Rodentolepis nana]|uniref:BRO1 domain-containing protein n=1 Tax=Rodentolepis nana TaxID=102285 RepID=A0A0R3TI56_RODNA|nr:unnamed protein product [Rodentolepis nana]